MRIPEPSFSGSRGLKLFQFVSTSLFHRERAVFAEKSMAGVAGIEPTRSTTQLLIQTEREIGHSA
jgi:hypothetical protein